MNEKENDEFENICRKIRATVKEYGRYCFTGVTIVGSHEGWVQVGGVSYLFVPTTFTTTLGGAVTFEMARFFEDV